MPVVYFMENEDDAALVSRSLRGDPAAFEALVEKYQRVVFNVALRMVSNYEDARDIAQTTFFKAYEKLGTYDPAFRFFSWIYRIMLNESLNHIERRKAHVPLDVHLASSTNLYEDAVSRELSESVQSALQQLSPEYREVVVLRHFAELSYGEMSSLLEIPEKTVKSRLYTARQRLSALLVDPRRAQ